jgi:MoaA/NifB/PqqE/SkfB family radical SAM enzyme
MSDRRIRELVLDVTNQCAMRCLHCSANSSPQLRDFISFEKMSQIVSDAVFLGLETLSLSGGEPLVHPEIADMVRLAHSCGVRDIRVFTSGLKLRGSKTTPIGDADVESLVDAGVSKVFFNLQGASVEAHERIAGTRGAFEAVLSGTRLCKKHGIYVGFHFVPMKPNWHEIGGIMSIARHLNVDEIGILRFVPQGRGLSNRGLLETDIEHLLVTVSKLMMKFERPKIRLGCPFNSISRLVPEWEIKRCPAASDMCHVMIDGTVAPCSAFKNASQMKSGNVYLQTFQKIWRTGFPNFAAERVKLSAEYRCTAQELGAPKAIVPVIAITRNFQRK